MPPDNEPLFLVSVICRKKTEEANFRKIEFASNHYEDRARFSESLEFVIKVSKLAYDKIEVGKVYFFPFVESLDLNSSKKEEVEDIQK